MQNQENWTEYRENPQSKDRLLVRFYDHPKYGGIKDNKDVWLDETVTHVAIKNVGSQSIFEDALKTKDKIKHYSERFPEAYDAYVNGKKVEINGTPLSDLAGLDGVTIAQWGLLGVHTVEQLADMNDGALSKLGHGGHMFRKAAQEKLELKRLKAQQTMLEQAEKIENERQSANDSAGESGDSRGTATVNGDRKQRPGRPKGSRNRKSSGARTSKKGLDASAKDADLRHDLGND